MCALFSPDILQAVAVKGLTTSMPVTRMENLPKRRPAKHVNLGASGQQRYSTPR